MENLVFVLECGIDSSRDQHSHDMDLKAIDLGSHAVKGESGKSEPVVRSDVSAYQ
jgi:hypothetical protein